MISQTTIARKLNLSQRTVSLCLAGSDRVADQTRKRVLKAAAELGYRPNRSALSMRSGRFNGVALLQSTNQQLSYLPGGLLAGIQQGLAERKMHLVMAALPLETLEDEETLPVVLSEWLVDGFLVNYAYGFSPKFADIIEQNRSPSIWLNTKRPFACIYPDDLGAGRKITEHLLALGHKRIDFFAHRTLDDHFSVADRFNGYEQAMNLAGLQARRHVISGDVNWRDIRHGVDMVKKFLSGPDRPTAVVCYEEFEAVRIVIASLELGLSIPRDLSIAAFHEMEICSSGFPITTMAIPEFEMGQKAMELLNARIEDKSSALPPIVMPYSKLFDHSTAPPPTAR